MQTVIFSINVPVSASAQLTHAAPEYLPVSSVVVKRITTSEHGITTEEFEIASGLLLADAFVSLHAALTQFVAPPMTAN